MIEDGRGISEAASSKFKRITNEAIVSALDGQDRKDRKRVSRVVNGIRAENGVDQGFHEIADGLSPDHKKNCGVSIYCILRSAHIQATIERFKTALIFSV